MPIAICLDYFCLDVFLFAVCHHFHFRAYFLGHIFGSVSDLEDLTSVRKYAPKNMLGNESGGTQQKKNVRYLVEAQKLSQAFKSA